MYLNAESRLTAGCYNTYDYTLNLRKYLFQEFRNPEVR